MKKQIETTVPGTFIEVEVYYDKGGYGLGQMMGFSEGADPRGYWLAVRRVTVRDGLSHFVLGDGIKSFLLEVKRQSPKAAAQADVLGAAKEAEVVASFIQKKGLQLAEKEVA